MYLIDTDVISQTTKPTPNEAAYRWLGRTEPESTYLSVITLQELQNGIDLMPPGQRRSRLEAWLDALVSQYFPGRILPVDERIARESGRLLASTKRAGHTSQVGDSLIAATARIHNLPVATLNRRHFIAFGVRVVEMEG